jgi:hypothetical protein
MGGRKARSVRRCLLRPLHRPARRERQDAANVPCEGNVQCQDGSLTLYGGAKSPGVDRESNWLPASGPFSLYIRAYWAGEPHPRWSAETAACQASTIGSSLRRARRGSEMRTRTIYRTSVVGTFRTCPGGLTTSSPARCKRTSQNPRSARDGGTACSHNGRVSWRKAALEFHTQDLRRSNDPVWWRRRGPSVGCKISHSAVLFRASTPGAT